MGRIIGIKRFFEGDKPNGFLFELNLDSNEMLNIRGHYNDVFLFCDNVYDCILDVSTRGRKDSTKYFLVPTKFRKNVNLNDSVKCQILDCCDRRFFIYAVKKAAFDTRVPHKRKLSHMHRSPGGFASESLKILSEKLPKDDSIKKFSG